MLNVSTIQLNPDIRIIARGVVKHTISYIKIIKPECTRVLTVTLPKGAKGWLTYDTILEIYDFVLDDQEKFIVNNHGYKYVKRLNLPDDFDGALNMGLNFSRGIKFVNATDKERIEYISKNVQAKRKLEEKEELPLDDVKFMVEGFLINNIFKYNCCDTLLGNKENFYEVKEYLEYMRKKALGKLISLQDYGMNPNNNFF